MTPRVTARICVAMMLAALAPPAVQAGQGPSEREPNNDRERADEVSTLAINGILDASDTEDWFKLTGQETSRATFNLSHAAGIDFDFEVFSGTTSAGRATGTNAVDTMTVDVPSTAFIRVWRSSGSGPYTVNIIPASGGTTSTPTPAAATPVNAIASTGFGEVEPNDIREQADVAAGRLIRGTLSSGTDVDWFKLDGSEGRRPTVRITHGSGYDVDFTVYSDTHNVGGSSSSQSPSSWVATVPGTGYIKVYSGKGSGSYTLEITPGEPGNDEREPNDQKSQADKVTDEFIDGTLSSSSDVDWFVLDGQEGDFPGFVVISNTPGFDPDIDIYENDTLLHRARSSENFEYAGGDMDGTCYIRVYSGSGSGSYTIEIIEDGDLDF